MTETAQEKRDDKKILEHLRIWESLRLQGALSVVKAGGGIFSLISDAYSNRDLWKTDPKLMEKYAENVMAYIRAVRAELGEAD